MRTVRLITAMGLGVAWVAGCTSPDENLRAWLGRDPTQWQLSPGTAMHRMESLAATLPAEAPEVFPPSLDAEGYVRVALRDNPTLRAAAARVRRLEARIPQVTSLDDPQLEVTPFGAGAETAAGTVGLMLGASQRFLFPGKLAAQGRIAAQEQWIAQEELRRVQLNIAAEVREAYWSYYYATRAIEVTGRNYELLQQMQEIAQSLYGANRASQQDVLRSTVQLSNLENELTTLRQNRVTAAAMLNNLMDRPIDAPLPEPLEVNPAAVTLELEELLKLAASGNPALEKIHHQLEAERARLKLAQLQRWPDVTLMVSYSFVDDTGLSLIANGRDQWGVGFGLNVPIWFDKLRAAEREAYAGMHESIAQLTAEQNRVAFQVQEALVKVRTQQRLVELFRERILPQARQTVSVSLSQYRAGKEDSLGMIDNWRNLLNYELLHHQSVAELGKSLARLQQAVGRDLPPDRPATPSTRRTTDESGSVTP